MNAVNFHTNHLFKLRQDQTKEVETKFFIAPTSGKFVKGETLTWTDSGYNIHSVVFNRADTDKDKSWVKRGNDNLLVYTYQLTR